MNIASHASQPATRAPAWALGVRCLIVLLLLPGLAQAAERRCGWLENPTPANFSLKDRQGEWVMGVQGGYQAPGMDTVPDLTTRGWVHTNGGYGHGCACIAGLFDARTRQVTRIDRAQPVALARCTVDRALPAP